MQLHSQLPLAGVRVVDFGQQIAGPAVAMILADLGATVLHIDPPTGPQWKHPANAILNRNKNCLSLDLKRGQGLTRARALIDSADIVIESYRPGCLAKLGLNFCELCAENPRLIALSMPGFASNDQLRSEWKATEGVIAAAAGAFTDMGFNRILMGLNPSFSPLPLGSAYATCLAAASLALALFGREKSGMGDYIEVPVIAAMMEGLSYNSYVVDDLPERYKTMRELEIERRRELNIPMDLSYADLQEYLDPFYRTYDCAEGGKFYCVCPSHRTHAKRCLEVLGLYEELIAEGLPEITDLHAPLSQWDGETSIGVYPLPKKWANILAEKMKLVFLTKTAHEWGTIFGEAQIPGAPHQTTRQWLNSEHSCTAGLTVEVFDSEYGLMKQPGPIVWLEESAHLMAPPTARRYVSYGEALEELRRVASADQLVIENRRAMPTREVNGWLDGVRILDLSNVIAGPHSTAFLARFGAEVIKIEPVVPSYDPLVGTLFAFQSDMGKRSGLIDINNAEGREAFERLVRSVDVLVINAAERQIRALDMDRDNLSAINPELIFCRLDCFGGPRWGPKSDYIGYDDIIQANSGIMSRFGGVDTPEEHAHLGTLDVNCGFAAGLIIAVALYQRERTALPSRARTSLSAVTNLAQLPFCLDYPGLGDHKEPSGRGVMGNHALSHFYQTWDDWLFIDASTEDLETMEQRVPGLQGIVATGDIHTFLKVAFQQASSAEWMERFIAADIAAVQPLSIETLRQQYGRPANGQAGIDRGSFSFSVHADHPSGHCLTRVDHYAIRPVRSAIAAIPPTERHGHSTRHILASVGYSETQIDAMIARNIASLGWCAEHLPSDNGECPKPSLRRPEEALSAHPGTLKREPVHQRDY